MRRSALHHVSSPQILIMLHFLISILLIRITFSKDIIFQVVLHVLPHNLILI